MSNIINNDKKYYQNDKKSNCFINMFSKKRLWCFKIVCAQHDIVIDTCQGQ